MLIEADFLKILMVQSNHCNSTSFPLLANINVISTKKAA